MFKTLLLIALAAVSITSSAAQSCSGNCGSTLNGVPALPFDGCYEEDFQLVLQSLSKTVIESEMTNTITVMFDQQPIVY